MGVGENVPVLSKDEPASLAGPLLHTHDGRCSPRDQSLELARKFIQKTHCVPPVSGSRADGDALVLNLSSSDDFEHNLSADALSIQLSNEIVHPFQRVAIDGHERISEQQAPLIRRTIRLHSDHQQGTGLTQLLFKLARQAYRKRSHSQKAPLNPTLRHQVLDHA